MHAVQVNGVADVQHVQKLVKGLHEGREVPRDRNAAARDRAKALRAERELRPEELALAPGERVQANQRRLGARGRGAPVVQRELDAVVRDDGATRDHPAELVERAAQVDRVSVRHVVLAQHLERPGDGAAAGGETDRARQPRAHPLHALGTPGDRSPPAPPADTHLRRRAPAAAPTAAAARAICVNTAAPAAGGAGARRRCPRRRRRRSTRARAARSPPSSADARELDAADFGRIGAVGDFSRQAAVGGACSARRARGVQFVAPSEAFGGCRLDGALEDVTSTPVCGPSLGITFVTRRSRTHGHERRASARRRHA